MTRAAAGFTMLELLAAMAGAALLLLVLTGVNHGLASRVQSTGRGSEHSQVQALLDASVGRAIPAEAAQFTASADHIRFPMEPAAALAGHRQALAELRLLPDNSISLSMVDGASGIIIAGSEMQRPTGLLQPIFLPELARHSDSTMQLTSIMLRGRDASGQTVTYSASPRLTGRRDCRFDPISMACRT